MVKEYSKKVECNLKTYYFDVKESQNGDIYVKITMIESKTSEEKRNKIIFFQDHFDKIYPVLVEALKYAKDNKSKI